MSTTQAISQMRAASVPSVSPQAQPRVSPQQKLNNLFKQIDTDGKGTVTKAQFEQAFSKLNLPTSVKSLGAEATFSKLDTKHSGSISKQDFVSGMEALMKNPSVAKTKQAGTETKAAAATPQGDPTAQPPAALPPAALPPAQEGGTIGKNINITA